MNYDTSNIDDITPPYLASYGLTEAPFSSKQDDRFLYLNSSLNERLELLKHYTQYGNLLLLITGDRGIGKSSLKQRFINNAEEEWQVCEIQSHTMMDASLLLRQVATGFRITEPPLEPAVLFEVLSEQLEQFHKLSMVPILIVDDAHELPQDALQALLYLAEHHSDQRTALRIILFCEPEIETMLEDPAIRSLKDRVTHNMELAALDEEQTAEYLRHRLAVAGLDGTSPFTPKLVNKIFKASAGVPSKINEYAHQNLLDDSEPFITDELDLDGDDIQSVNPFNRRNILLSGFAAVIIIVVLFYQDNINRLFEEPSNNIENNLTKDQEENTLVEASPDIIVKNESPIKVKPTVEKTIEFKLNQELALTNNKDEKPQTKTAITPAPNTLRLNSVNPSPVPSSKQRQIISISGSGFHKRQKVKVSWTDKEKILADTQVNVTSDSYMNLILNTGTQADIWTVTVIDTVKNIESNSITFDVVAAKNEITAKQNKTSPPAKKLTNTTLTKLATQKSNGIYKQNWIEQQNKNHFTLQLLGTHQKNTLPKYLKKYALNNDAATFKSMRNNKEWFTLVYGNYPTKAEAQLAAKKLPKGVSKPWIRSFASILPSLNKEINTKIIPSANNIPSDNQEGWLWSQDPSHYTLQLTAGTDKKAIQAYIKRHQLRGKAVYFHRLRDGKDWYILVHGSYAGYSKAKQAISQLPSAVQKSKPWTRTFGAIHAELN